MAFLEDISSALQTYKEHIFIFGLGFITLHIATGIYSIYLSPLSKFPGPKSAAFTDWYKTWIEAFQQKSWTVHLRELHKKYGPIVRVGPNELHFEKPQAYHDIYNNSNRWDKEAMLYQSFGEDRSSFGYLEYKEAKKRKDIMQPLFSRRAVIDLQFLVQENVDRFCDVLKRRNAEGKSSDLFFGWRCFTMDTIIRFCFNRTVDAINSPDFQAPIIEAMEASLPAFIIFKHFPLIRKMVYGMPPWLSIITSPATSGLIRLQVILGKQVKEVLSNPESLNNSPHPIIYHRLLDKETTKGEIPCAGSLYEEAQALMFGGGDTTGNTLMLGTFHIVRKPEIYSRLKKELKAAWPDLNKAPKFEELEKLPYLTAIVKESLRVNPGVASPLLRVTPNTNVTIAGAVIPPGTIVGQAGSFVHESEEIFPNAIDFDPERWLSKDAASLEKWLISFSKGPRMCIGQNLAYCELYLGFAALFRRFDLELDGTISSDLTWRECFLPYFQGRHLTCYCRPVSS